VAEIAPSPPRHLALEGAIPARAVEMEAMDRVLMEVEVATATAAKAAAVVVVVVEQERHHTCPHRSRGLLEETMERLAVDMVVAALVVMEAIQRLPQLQLGDNPQEEWVCRVDLD
jgi:hypothetical protein